MYAASMFDAADHWAYEQLDEDDRDFEATRAHYEQMVVEMEDYQANAGDAAKSAGFESAAAMIKKAKQEARQEAITAIREEMEQWDGVADSAAWMQLLQQAQQQ